ncbi:MAG: hypothetical protein WDO06_07580 [Actinomycetota bacterium]
MAIKDKDIQIEIFDPGADQALALAPISRKDRANYVMIEKQSSEIQRIRVQKASPAITLCSLEVHHRSTP